MSSAPLHMTACKPFREKRWCMCPMGTVETKILQFSMLVYVFTNSRNVYRIPSILKFSNLTDPAKLLLSLLLLQPPEWCLIHMLLKVIVCCLTHKYWFSVQNLRNYHTKVEPTICYLNSNVASQCTGSWGFTLKTSLLKGNPSSSIAWCLKNHRWKCSRTSISLPAIVYHAIQAYTCGCKTWFSSSPLYLTPKSTKSV